MHGPSPDFPHFFHLSLVIATFHVSLPYFFRISAPMAKKARKLENNGEASDDSGAIVLTPKMSLINGINIIVGCMIGSGIFISPKGVLANTGLDFQIFLSFVNF